MSRNILFAATLGAALFTAPAALAQVAPPPPPPGATVDATPFLETAGASDVYEITSSQIALDKSASPGVRELATMLIGHHSKTTNVTLAAAKAAGIMAPPAPVLNAQHRRMIDELLAAGPGDFDRLYLGQQLPAHQGALALQQGYSQTGDTPQLRKAAAGAIPIITMHIEHIQHLMM